MNPQKKFKTATNSNNHISQQIKDEPISCNTNGAGAADVSIIPNSYNTTTTTTTTNPTTTNTTSATTININDSNNINAIHAPAVYNSSAVITNANHPQINETSNGTVVRKPRRSIKAEGSCLHGMLREGEAKVIDASKLGKRLSSEIWNSFGAIQVHNDFSYPLIDTKVVPDGASTVRICQFFVACDRCFSVFKYDGHAYGTTGLVKHVKNCPNSSIKQEPNSDTNNNKSSHHSANAASHSRLDSTHASNISTTIGGHGTTTASQASAARRRRESTPRSRTQTTPSLRHLAKAVEELRCEQSELKQKIQDLINIVSGTNYVGHIQIISNEGEKMGEDTPMPAKEESID